MNIRTILFPTDCAVPEDRSCQIAAGLARDYGAKLVVLHAWQPAPIMDTRIGPVPVVDPDEIRTEEKQKLDAREPPDRGVPVERVLMEGEPGEAILRAARERECDLIVMGTHGRTGLSRIIRGSVAEHVLRRAPCPVLTVKEPLARRESLPVALTAGYRP
jgi:nucleotide-binding universal stress UspA family protein